jgi:putative ABC transport system ATP-binding protein
MSTIIGSQLSKRYGRGEGTVTAIADMNFAIRSGEFVGIMGESGAGKSTLLSIMGAMNAPSEGTLTVEDIDVYRLDREKRADFRREFLGFIFQSHHLIPYLSLEENVLLPLATVKAPRQAKKQMAADALASVGLADKRRRLPGQISGGEKERTAIARAIVNRPPVILADEPTGNLDSKNSGEIMNLLRALNAGGTTVVMVTHSQSCARCADRVLHVRDGHLDLAA